MDIKEIKAKGERREISTEIENRIHALCNQTFEAYRNTAWFQGLGAKITTAEILLDEMKSLLAELAKLDPENT